MASENNFPTIRDFRDRLNDLVDQGLGDQLVQLLIVPDATMQAISRVVNDGCDPSPDKPALMIEFEGIAGRMPVLIYSTDRMEEEGREMMSRAIQ